MKSYASIVVALYEGIFVDAAVRWPDIKDSMDKDLSYLRRALEDRGLEFYTLILPSYCQWFDRSIDDGCFQVSNIPKGIPRHRRRPRLFSGFLAKVFDNDGMLRHDADAGAVLFFRTLCQSLKKLEVPPSSSALKKTVKEFFDVEEHLPPSYPDTWDSDVPIWKPRLGHPIWGPDIEGAQEQPDLFGCSSRSDSRIPWDTLWQLARRITSELGEPDWWSIQPKHGPGVVSEQGWESKFDFPSWPKKLDLWFPYDWFGSESLDSDQIPSYYEPTSRLIAVPKTVKGPRLICAEPMAHQWIQQGIWRWLRKRIPKTVLSRSISFEDQSESQRWALRGSHDGSLATLDLSAASDRLSTRLVEYIFQGSSLLDGFHASRTRMTQQLLCPELEKFCALRKFATMGSALTFPVQSIVFTILCVWAYRLYHGRENNWTDWRSDFSKVRVFGDDLIVPSETYGLTRFVLHECGLLVNEDKSFAGDHFRESCGLDAFNGVDVTPPRYKTPYSGSAASTVALIEYTNNLFLKGFWHTAEKMLRFVPSKFRKLLTVSLPQGGGDLVSFTGSDFHLRKQFWDEDLQRSYIRRLLVTSKVKYVTGSERSRLSQYFWDDPASLRTDALGPLFDWEPGTPRPGELYFGSSRSYH